MRLIYKIFTLFLILILVFATGEFYLMQIKPVNHYDSSVTIQTDFTSGTYYNMSSVKAYINTSFTGSPILNMTNPGGGFQIYLVYIGNTTQQLSQNITINHGTEGSTPSIPCYLNISNINPLWLQYACSIELGANITNNHLVSTSNVTIFSNISAPAGYYGFRLLVLGGSEVGKINVILNMKYIYIDNETKGSGMHRPY